MPNRDYEIKLDRARDNELNANLEQAPQPSQEEWADWLREIDNSEGTNHE